VPRTVTDRRRAAALAAAAATVAALLLPRARGIDPLPDGLQAQYFQNADWHGNAARTSPASVASTDRLAADTDGFPSQSLSASWTGWIVAPASGAYTFATSSSGASLVYVDNELVVDNGGEHPLRSKTGPTLALDRGVHALFVKYAQAQGRPQLTLLWQRGSGRFEPVPAWTLRPRRVAYARAIADRAADLAARVAWLFWSAALLAAGVFAFAPQIRASAARAGGTIARLRREHAWRPLVWIVVASTLLNVVGLWWGLPNGLWAGDELTPKNVASAWALHFSNGWHDRYPPLHFYALTLAYLPVIAARDTFGLEPSLGDQLFVVAGRLLTVAMAAATLVVLFFLGRRVFGSRAGLFAAAAFALLAPFVYYAKTANVDVPYVMWFAAALWFYVQVLERGTLRDFLLWAVAATLAVCTKDQAYGLFAAMPLAVAYDGRGRRVFDRRLLVAAAAAIVLFALLYNLPLNAAGFVEHVRTLVGASGDYRAYEPTAAGRWALFGVTMRLLGRSWGWPMFLVAAIGVAIALASRTHRRMAICLLLPVASYYLTFINVVLYTYDRFLLPVFLILALFCGHALDRFTRAPAGRGWRAIAVAGLLSYTLMYAATVDAMMLTDTRYVVERWLREHVDDESRVASTSIVTYMPRLDDFDAPAIFDRSALAAIKPRFCVVNVDYTSAEPPGTPLGQLISTLRSGGGPYRLVFTARPSKPWPWLPWGHPDLVGDRRSEEMVSFLRNISPTIEVYERRAAQ